MLIDYTYNTSGPKDPILVLYLLGEVLTKNPTSMNQTEDISFAEVIMHVNNLSLCSYYSIFTIQNVLALSNALVEINPDEVCITSIYSASIK